MVDGHESVAWNHTSHILAMMINTNGGGKKRRPVLPEKMNPYAKKAHKKRMTKKQRNAVLRSWIGVRLKDE